MKINRDLIFVTRFNGWSLRVAAYAYFKPPRGLFPTPQSSPRVAITTKNR